MSGRILDGKVALITGAGGGIGRASALAFAEAGARLAVCDIDATRAEETAHLIQDKRGDAIAFGTDIRDGTSVDLLVVRTVEHFGRLDCAMNNAGIGSQAAVSLADCTDEHWDSVMAVNLRGLFICVRAEIRQMAKQGHGSIVNIASVGGLVGSAKAPAYVSSKHGAIGLTRAAALDHARDGIRINAVCPGYIEGTAMMASFIAKAPVERVEFLKTAQPMGRLGSTEEVAQAAIWLCSDLASFTTGAVLTVDGGFTAA